MPLVVGVSFKRAGKVYYFDPNGIVLREGDCVVAETARGFEFGEVLLDPKEVSDSEIVSPLKKVVRKATPSDISREEANRQKEKNAYSTCQQKIQTHNLPMKLIDAEYCFDGSQVTFYFSAEARVDFRELVKDLAGALRTKVQLHQVGVRDEAKLFGGMGPCGRGLCCATFLNGFEPVSMKMAKEQCLFLNPLKFSGICGKLMCCLKYEYQIYKDSKNFLPAIGAIVTTPKGPAKVCEVNVIRESIGGHLEDGTTVHCLASELIDFVPRCGAQRNGCAECHAAQAPVEAEEIESAEEVPISSPAPTASSPAASSEQTEGSEGAKRRRPRRRPNRRRKSSGEGANPPGPSENK
jgi:cell fate regulator YaaT (PSP1 superfamily)